MEVLISTQTIIEGMRKAVTDGTVLSPEDWINGGMKLTALLGGENDKYADMYQKAHRIQSEAIGKGDSSSSAEALMKASDEYRDMQKQKGLCDYGMEMVRMCKIRSQLGKKEYPLSDI